MKESGSIKHSFLFKSFEWFSQISLSICLGKQKITAPEKLERDGD
jgi:hypothetical protein